MRFMHLVMLGFAHAVMVGISRGGQDRGGESKEKSFFHGGVLSVDCGGYMGRISFVANSIKQAPAGLNNGSFHHL